MKVASRRTSRQPQMGSRPRDAQREHDGLGQERADTGAGQPEEKDAGHDQDERGPASHQLSHPPTRRLVQSQEEPEEHVAGRAQQHRGCYRRR